MTRDQEILKVKNLGQKIGYGNLMDIAAALWSMGESDDRVERFVYASVGKEDIKEESLEKVHGEIQDRIMEIKRIFGKMNSIVLKGE